jgi:hypothetical protein
MSTTFSPLYIAAAINAVERNQAASLAGAIDIDLVTYPTAYPLTRALDVDFIREHGWVGGAQLRRVMLRMGAMPRASAADAPLVDEQTLSDAIDERAHFTRFPLDYPAINPNYEGR